MPVLQVQLQASFVLLIGTVGWALSGLRRGREAARLTAAGYTAALQETAAAYAAAVNNSNVVTSTAVVDVHASSAGTLTAGSARQQMQGGSLKHRVSGKASAAGASGGTASPVASKQQQQQQHAATPHSIYKSRPPGSQVGLSSCKGSATTSQCIPTMT
jgi:hypothetical protein